MTTLAAFHSVEGDGNVSAIYLMSDSKITSTKSPMYSILNAQKIFNFRESSDIIGYAGDTLFGSNSLSKITSIIDFLGLFKRITNVKEKANVLLDFLNKEYRSFPKSLYSGSNEFVYITRNNNIFTVFEIYLYNGIFASKLVEIKKESDILITCGSGKEAFEDMFTEKLSLNNDNKTSRIVFWSFINHIVSKKDPNTGGPPQLMFLNKNGQSKAAVIKLKDDYYLQGSKIDPKNISDKRIEIRNEFFEFIDKNGNLFSKAQKYYLK